jgi:hypothetical protein
MVRIRVFEEDYSDYMTDWVDVSEDEYKLLKRWFKVEELKDIQWYIAEATKRQKQYEAQQKKYKAESEARKERAAKAAETRKRKLLEKLKKELEDETNS